MLNSEIISTTVIYTGESRSLTIKTFLPSNVFHMLKKNIQTVSLRRYRTIQIATTWSKCNTSSRNSPWPRRKISVYNTLHSLQQLIEFRARESLLLVSSSWLPDLWECYFVRSSWIQRRTPTKMHVYKN